MPENYAKGPISGRWLRISDKYPYEFLEPDVALPSIVLRNYQEAAVNSIMRSIVNRLGNPVVAMPTGTGKSLVIAALVKRLQETWAGTRVMMLTHVKELIEQDFETLLKLWPTAPAGIYSAGVGRRDVDAPTTFAGIQSVYRKPELFQGKHVVIIDECHLVSPKGDTMYRQFIDALRERVPNLVVVGFSATPFRLGQGMLTDEDGLFNHVCYDLTGRMEFNWLIQEGWLAPLVPRPTEASLDTSNVRIQRGEFHRKELQAAVNKEEVTVAALQETLHYAQDRKHWLIFASGIDHAVNVADILDSTFNIPAKAVHSKMSDDERDQAILDFKEGRIRALVNNEILTTGFDFPSIDCIVMLRPTQSAALWVQMLGRGTRPAPGKQDCLVLDFAENTPRLGPINDPVLPRARGKGGGGGGAPVRICEVCGAYSHASARFCENPGCGAEFPRNVKIGPIAGAGKLIADLEVELVRHKVTHITYHVHKKAGKPDSMCVTYYAGVRRFKQYICVEHEGYAQYIAKKWWEARYQWGMPPTTEAGMEVVKDLKVPTTITVAEKGKWPEVVGYEFA